MSEEKETIIDGVDVKICKHYDIDNNYCDQSYLGEGGLLKNTKNPKRCQQNPNCYFKQLKHLQEENEKLKEKNKELLNLSNRGGALLVAESTKNKKYKQALEEIREDLEQDTTCESRECGCDDYGECLKCVKETILDKINEVLNVEND